MIETRARAMFLTLHTVARSSAVPVVALVSLSQFDLHAVKALSMLGDAPVYLSVTIWKSNECD